MKISYNWLKTHFSTNKTAEEVGELLTQAGLEVGRTTPFHLIPPELVVGEVLTCEPHPNATNLQKTTVDIGAAAPLSIICGAPNVAAGQKVVVAPEGTTLFPLPGRVPLKIKGRNIRGERSEGMICAANEIGILPKMEQTGILTLADHYSPGTPAEVCFKLSGDTVFEIDITPNRGDACSHLGVARDLAAVSGKNIELPECKPFLPTDNLPIQVTIQDKTACKAYTGIVVSNLTLGPSPIWLQKRLRAVGITPSNNVLDIAHFILHDLGQPLHFYDYDAIKGKKLIVKRANPETSFTTLQEATYTLSEEDLIVADAKGPLCLAGIIGGNRAKVTHATRRIFIESAHFDPTTISKRARQHGISTEASFRFERGVDPARRGFAVKRAVELLEKLAGGVVASQPVDYSSKREEPVTIPFSYSYLRRLVGEEIPAHTVQQILQNLDFSLKEVTEEGFVAVVPSYRQGITRPVDLVEEILRIYGYSSLIEKKEALTFPPPLATPPPTDHRLQDQIAYFLAAKGYREIRTNAIVDSQYATLFPTHPPKKTIHLATPKSSHLDSLRTTLLFSGLEVVRHNLHYQHTSIKLFEAGKVYTQHKDSYKESARWGLFLAGTAALPNWSAPSRPMTFYDLSAAFHGLCHYFGAPAPTLIPCAHPHYSNAVAVKLGQTSLGTLGAVAPTILQKMGIEGPLFFGEVDFLSLLKQRAPSAYKSVVRVPHLSRDLSLCLKEQVSYTEVIAAIREQQIKELVEVYVVDCYRDTSLGAGKKAYTLRFMLQDPTKTLKEHRVKQLMEKLSIGLQESLEATIRG